MTRMEEVLDEASKAIRSRLGDGVDLASSASALVVRFTSFEPAVVVVAVDDAERPSFRVTYPCLQAHHASLAEAQDVEAGGTLLQGVLWIVCAVAEHGVALPEFPHPHVLRQLRRRQRASDAGSR